MRCFSRGYWQVTCRIHWHYRPWTTSPALWQAPPTALMVWQLAEAVAHVVMAVRNPKTAHELINQWSASWHGLPLHIEVMEFCNPREVGGVTITSNCFYNTGWTEDTWVIINYLHHQYPTAPLFAIGTSIGANILVKYLGEDREKVPVARAVAICFPWDLFVFEEKKKKKLKWAPWLHSWSILDSHSI